MKEKANACLSCGMPIEKKEDHPKSDLSIPYCKYCANEDGSLKTYEEIKDGMAEFLVNTQGMSFSAAQKISVDIMAKMPAWKKG